MSDIKFSTFAELVRLRFEFYKMHRRRLQRGHNFGQILSAINSFEKCAEKILAERDKYFKKH